MDKTLRSQALEAKKASRALSILKTNTKNAALNAMAEAILAKKTEILKANALDVEAARKNGLSGSLLGRLTLDEEKLKRIAESLKNIARLPDPVGKILQITKRPNGLVIKKVRVPIGVITIIYESRPNVTADCMALCLKSGNAVILKGGSEAKNSNRALFQAMNQAAIKKGVPVGTFQLIDTSDRGKVKELLGFSDLIDLVIPRGGEGLIREVATNSKIPVIKHYKGVCHVFVDKKADLKKARNIVVNAKVQNPGVCNALETLLVHKDIAQKFLPAMGEDLVKNNVELRGDKASQSILKGLKAATEEDWYAEYLDLILAIRVVKDLNEAIQHIQAYGSNHSDAIVTKDKKAAEIFTQSVDSACVFVNTSTRFNDGGEFGMGAEMGISTDKLHARGPMGLEELTTYKYIVVGDGQIRK